MDTDFYRGESVFIRVHPWLNFIDRNDYLDRFLFIELRLRRARLSLDQIVLDLGRSATDAAG